MDASDTPPVPPRRARAWVAVLVVGLGAAAVFLWPAGEGVPKARSRDAAPAPTPTPAPLRAAEVPPALAPPAPTPPLPPAPTPPPASGVDAHAGQRAFTGEVPEAISLIPFDMARTIERARERRWFDEGDAAYALAQSALAGAEGYALRLETDRLHRAFDGAIRVVAADAELRNASFDALFVPPYVICAEREGRDVDPSKVLFEIPAVRDAYRREFAERAAARARRMARVGRLLRQTYVEFLRRHGESADLHDLMGEFGGRPDLPISKRSFRDGCPLVVWIAERESPRGPTLPLVTFPAGRLVVAGADLDDPRYAPYLIEEAARQLLLWFRRQGNEWGTPWGPQTYFDAGFPALWSAVDVGPDDGLTWRPVGSWARIFEQFRRAERAAPLFGIRELVGFEGGSAVEAAAVHFALTPPVGALLVRAESASLLAFLRDGAGGKRRPAYERFVASMCAVVSAEAEPSGVRLDPAGLPLNETPDPTAPSPVSRSFANHFGLQTAADWTALDEEFRAYVTDVLKDLPKEPEARPAQARAGTAPSLEVFGVSGPR